MSKTDDEKANEELMQRNIAYYSVMLSAFIEGRNEFDKQMLTISMAAIGLLITIYEKFVTNSAWSKLLFGGSLLAFGANILVILFIFKKNPAYIAHELKGEHNEASKTTKDLAKYDSLAHCSFGVALILVLLTAAFKITGDPMKKENSPNTRSLEGVGILKPITPTTTVAPQPTTAPTNSNSNNNSKITK